MLWRPEWARPTGSARRTGDHRCFSVRPRPRPRHFQPAEDDSFVITELTGRKQKNPYYAVRFESGKVGYIRPELFHEALNLTIVSSDPRAGEKEKAEKLASEEKARVEWINSQPWSSCH